MSQLQTGLGSKLKGGMLVLALVALGVAALWGCYPGDITSVTELDIVLTLYDTTHVWIAPASFYLADTVVHMVDTVDTSNNVNLSRAFDNLIITETRDALLAYGYVEKTDPDSAQYFVTLTALGIRNWTVDVWYPYWPCCWYGWGWYYPPIYDVDTYETGTLFIDMYDQNMVDSVGQRIDRPWNALLNGLLGTSASLTQQRLQSGIRQAYAQSPYLKPQ